jgi:DNA-binding CsgD family transcriptional regulator
MKNERRLSIIFFSLFSSWLLAFLFEGQVFYAISSYHNMNPSTMASASMACHLLGLFSCGFFLKTLRSARHLMILSIVYFIAVSILFFFPPSYLWDIAIMSSAFLSGACVASWGFYFREFSPGKIRLNTAAEMLICSNILMVALNMAAVLIHPYLGLALSILALFTALILLLGLPVKETSPAKAAVNPAKPLALLCLFIAIITINSGLMYRVVNPAFAHHKELISWFWAIPYIAALLIVKKLPDRIDRSYILYIAVTMLGLSFIGFMILDRSVLSYILIDTLMLGACGVFDLFWWSILGEMLDIHKNPAKILGIGLSANVLGIFIGGILGNSIMSSALPGNNPSIAALVVVFIILVILPPLHKHLSILLKGSTFTAVPYESASSEQAGTAEIFEAAGLLTEREIEITKLLLRGRTYKMIADELYLSENTVKTHIKNIYSKFNVQSKTGLIKLLKDNRYYTEQ